MKKVLLKLTSLTLVLAMLFGSALSVSAAEVNAKQASLENVIEKIKADHPDAEIVIENDVISVLVSQTEDQVMQVNTKAKMGETVDLMAAETTYYAPDGGTWTSFTPPLIYALNPSLTKPWAVVYVPHDKAEVLYEGLVLDDLVSFVGTLVAADSAIDYIIEKVKEKFNISFTYTQMAFFIMERTMAAFIYLNEQSFAKAYLESSENKVRIDFCTMDGWSVNIYQAWEGNYVTNSPWQDFEPRFQRGVINL